MTRAADSVSAPMKVSAHSLRKLAAEAGKAGAETTALAREIVERKLAEGTAEFAEKTQRTRKSFTKRTKSARKELRMSSAAARTEALARAEALRKPGRKAKQAAITAAKSAGKSRRRGKKDFVAAQKEFRAALAEAKSVAKGERTGRRRWPWLLGLTALVAAGGMVYARRSTQLAEDLPAAETPPAPPAPPAPAKTAPVHNGQKAKTEHPT